jgi:hypothetical protein
MEAESLRTSNGGSRLCGDEELLGDSWLVAAASESGGNNMREVKSPTLEGENPRPSLN